MKTLIDTPPIACPNHNGGFDCNPFCRLCEGEQETSLSELIAEADSVAFDGCHKIYLNMDPKQTMKMVDYGYSRIVTDTPATMENVVAQWYDDSCGLRFIDAVFTNEDGTDKFVIVVGQEFSDE